MGAVTGAGVVVVVGADVVVVAEVVVVVVAGSAVCDAGVAVGFGFSSGGGSLTAASWGRLPLPVSRTFGNEI